MFDVWDIAAAGGASEAAVSANRKGHRNIRAVPFRAGTDNQENTWLLQKLATTKFPLCLALAEMVEPTRIRDRSMALEWRPQEENVFADALTNLDFSAFRSELRVHVRWSDLSFLVLPALSVRAFRVQGRGRAPAGEEEGES